MANTYSQIYNHFVFAVQNRRSLIKSEWQEELYKYITGCITQHQCKLLSIGGMPDHVHILVGMNPCIAPTVLITDVKRSSALWINKKFYRPGFFSWQKGYGVFSYAKSAITNVSTYIEKQALHHQKQTLQTEYLNILSHFGVEHDEKYIFHPVN